MTPDELSRQQRRRICNLLPACVAGAGLLVYLLTVNHWLSFGSLGLVSRVSGWEWAPQLMQPLTYLVTLPLRLLPASILPLALNVLTAGLGAFTLWLLARSVAILPRDRLASFRSLAASHTSWEMPLAWLPPLLASVAFGLQLTVWEHATLATGEMFDLCLLAYVVRSLLEFRHSGRARWLDRAVLVAALAATNNFAALGYLPLVLIAVWWLKGIEFLEARFLARVTVLVLGGFSLYLLLPTLVAFTPDSPLDFWKAFRQNLGSQLGMLKDLLTLFYNLHRDVAVLLALVSLLPLLFMSIRWSSFSGGSLHLGAALVTLPFHIAHAALFAICLWVFIDPPFGPRVVGQRLAFFPYLSVYYLAALSVGYYGGYFLQYFADYPPDDWAIGAATRRKFARLVRFVGLFLLVAMPVILIGKNFPAIRLANSDLPLRQAQEMAGGLPAEGSVVLSDDPLRRLLVQAALAREGKLATHIAVDTSLLPAPEYQRSLHRQYPERIPTPEDVPAGRDADAMAVLRFLAGMAQTNTIYYLHPSFGYYFEAFHLEPRGPVFALLPYQTNSLFLPVTPTNVLATGQAYWDRIEPEFLRVLTNRVELAMNPPRTPWSQFMRRLRIRPDSDTPAYVFAAWQSRQLTAFGVELQRAGQLEAAGRWFRTALALKPDNLSATANLVVNSNLLAGLPVRGDRTRPAEAELGRYGNWERALNENGPFDSPNFNYSVGMVFAANSLYRQAAGQFNRAAELDSTCTPALLMLGSIYGLGNRYDEVLAVVSQIRTNAGFKLLTPNERVELAINEAGARLGRGELEAAERIVTEVLNTRTNDPAVLERVFSLYTSSGNQTNALAIVRRQQAAQPNLDVPFVNEGYVWMILGDFSNAIPVLTRALTLNSNSVYARFNRAFALLRTGQFAASQQDYQWLDNLDPNVPQVMYGLGEVAYQGRDTNEAIRHYTRYLSNAPPNAVEIPQVQERLKELEGPRK
jgi:tetratricopeptide (TPR) repeat protein